MQELTDPELNVTRLAAKSEMSEVYLRKLFHMRYGCSPKQYIALSRLQYAKELMTIPTLTLEEIALQSGFSSLSYFCRTFKEQYGESPGEIRKELLKNEIEKA